MGNKSSLMLQDDEIKQISDETGFSAPQIEKLYTRFAQLDRTNCGSLSKDDLLSIPELAINPLCDRLIQMFFHGCTSEDEERINFRQFMNILSIFRSSSCSSLPITTSSEKTNQSSDSKHSKTSKNNSSQKPTEIKTIESSSRELDVKTNTKSKDNLGNKLHFIFRIYDADNDGKISFNDLRCILKMMVGNYIEDNQLDKIANRAFMEVDEDNDGFIEFDEFSKVFSGKNLDDKLRVKFFN